MKRFLMLLLMMVMIAGVAFAEGDVDEPVSVGAAVALYTIVSVVMWYVIDWIKSIFVSQEVPEKLYQLIMLVLCLGVGIGLALAFKLDAFVLVAALMRQIIADIPVIEPSLVGYIFGGLMLASGSGAIHKISKLFQKEEY